MKDRKIKDYFKWGLLVFCCLSAREGMAQRLVEGYVVDDQTGEGLPFTTVYVEKAYRGTCCDLSGYFSLILGARDSVLLFSQMGYLPQKLNIYREEGKGGKYIVRLNPALYILPEAAFSVTPLSAEKLLEKAFRNLKRNHISEPYESILSVQGRKEENQQVVAHYRAKIKAFYPGYGKLYTLEDSLKYTCLKFTREEDRSRAHRLVESRKGLGKWVGQDILYSRSFKMLKASFSFRYVEMSGSHYIVEANRVRDTLSGSRKHLLYKIRYQFTVAKKNLAIEHIRGWSFTGDSSTYLKRDFEVEYTRGDGGYCLGKLDYQGIHYTRSHPEQPPVITYEYIGVVREEDKP